MAPRKRISKIGSGKVLLAVQRTDDHSSRHSVSTETDQSPAKLKKIQAPVAEQPFVPDPQEKSCEAAKNGAMEVEPTDRVVEPRSGEPLINSVMTNQREEANKLDCQRLQELMIMINENPPPSWYLASQMWVMVGNLEERIEAYNLLKKHNEGQDKEALSPPAEI
ncbi:uncharacterized protein LOC108143171 [Drosophila elegans]|uniref:uncharacterized protein LOC108143171 n=1 Tax=Drosophila elegans TaxID=30023 RepID=UPI0007E7F0AD|nr:uncharacterized protein LOC108143171 [Drosophila elegans]